MTGQPAGAQQCRQRFLKDWMTSGAARRGPEDNGGVERKRGFLVYSFRDRQYGRPVGPLSGVKLRSSGSSDCRRLDFPFTLIGAVEVLRPKWPPNSSSLHLKMIGSVESSEIRREAMSRRARYSGIWASLKPNRAPIPAKCVLCSPGDRGLPDRRLHRPGFKG